MEERVGLSKAVGWAPSQLLPCQPVSLAIPGALPALRLDSLAGFFRVIFWVPQQVLSRVAFVLQGE